jgi:hypothetical protein
MQNAKRSGSNSTTRTGNVVGNNATHTTDTFSLFPKLDADDLNELKLSVLRTLWDVNKDINTIEDYLLQYQSQRGGTGSELWSALETLHKVSLLLQSINKHGTSIRQ